MRWPVALTPLWALEVSPDGQTAGCAANSVVPVKGQDTSCLSDALRCPADQVRAKQGAKLHHC